MKRIILPLTLIVISLTSCSHDNENTTEQAKTGVTLKIENTASNSTTGKNVNRGTVVPVWVEKITVTSKNILSQLSQVTDFDMVASGGEDGFKLDNVPLGNTEFSAVTTTNTVGSVLLSGVTVASNTFTVQKARNPYTIYTSPLQTKNITTLDNTVTLPMTTNNGRIIAEFKSGANLPAGYYFTVEATTSTGYTASITVKRTTPASEIGSFYWSNAGAVAGAKVSYTFKMYNSVDQLVNTVLISKTIQANTDLNTTYTITEKDINVVENDATFQFQITAVTDENVNGITPKDETLSPAFSFNFNTTITKTYEVKGWNKLNVVQVGNPTGYTDTIVITNADTNAVLYSGVTTAYLNVDVPLNGAKNVKIVYTQPTPSAQSMTVKTLN